jgi:hypothetical protein
MFVLVVLNIHEIYLKLKSGFRIIHKFQLLYSIIITRKDKFDV